MFLPFCVLESLSSKDMSYKGSVRSVKRRSGRACGGIFVRPRDGKWPMNLVLKVFFSGVTASGKIGVLHWGVFGS